MGTYNFSIDKISQIVNYLLKKYNYRLNYTKLIKLLYICEKESYKRFDTPLCYDDLVNMDNGPVLSGLYDLIRGRYRENSFQCKWNTYFLTDGYDLVSIIEDKLPISELSRREIKIIDAIDEKYHRFTYGQLIDLVHKKRLFPEWEDPDGSSDSIDLRTLLKSVGRTDEEINSIFRDEQYFRKEKELISEITK